MERSEFRQVQSTSECITLLEPRYTFCEAIGESLNSSFRLGHSIRVEHFLNRSDPNGLRSTRTADGYPNTENTLFKAIIAAFVVVDSIASATG
ncbi:hypothetical protein AYI69_g6148 [Smittium culicis]|uniref:Uncharacterized protein n=1 Tax=Smittium culicis TaxID=133412 RepID=A0A1R1Y120_9FUNG|nr:hypothetical protein AYI69_g6148 [Smittium culicis]